MKSIRQIAEELGVSKQAVQKRISREPLSKRIQAYIVTNGNTKYISEQGEMLIKSAFNKTVSIDKNDNQQPYVHSNVHSELIKLLINSVDNLKEQIEELTATMKTQSMNANKIPKRKFYPRNKCVKTKKTSTPIKRLMRIIGKN